MKKMLFLFAARQLPVLLLFLLLSVPGLAQTAERSAKFCPVPPVDSTLTAGEAARDNLWPGFGTGSRRQADMASATAFRTADVLGFALTGVGAVGLAATAIQHNAGARLFSTASDAGYYVFGGVAVAGIATVVVSRVLAVRKAREYDLFLFPTAVQGGAGLTLSYRF